LGSDTQTGGGDQTYNSECSHHIFSCFEYEKETMLSIPILYRAQYALGSSSADVPITPIPLAIFLLLAGLRPL
jgi:hypothetical protein